MKLTDILDWRSNAQPWDFYAFGFNITHKEVMNIVRYVNDVYKATGSSLRVRKSWKALQACEEGEELE